MTNAFVTIFAREKENPVVEWTSYPVEKA